MRKFYCDFVETDECFGDGSEDDGEKNDEENMLGGNIR